MAGFSEEGGEYGDGITTKLKFCEKKREKKTRVLLEKKKTRVFFFRESHDKLPRNHAHKKETRTNCTYLDVGKGFQTFDGEISLGQHRAAVSRQTLEWSPEPLPRP